MVRRRRPHVRRQKRFMDLLWPFLLIILIGIIVVLVVQFVWSFVDQQQTKLKNEIYLYLDQGQAELLAWGQTEWTKAYDGQLVLEGDMMSTERASRGFLEFYKGSRVRLDAETKLEIDEIDTSGDVDEVRLALQTGRVWLNVEEDYDSMMRFVVETDNLRVTSYGTIFEVGLTDRETVRVLEGEVKVEVIEESSGREIVLEDVRVGVGQQIEVTASDIAAIEARQPVSLLAAVDDTWKATDWYVWNDEEDAVPAIAVVDEVIEEIVIEEDTTTAETVLGVTIEAVEEEEEVYDGMAPVVTITTPEMSPYTLTENDEMPFSIHGTTSGNTANVTVTSYDADGNASPYTLQHYESGSTEWRYGASSDYGNLREGRNLFTVVAKNGSDMESEAVEVIIQVPEGMFAVEEEKETEEVSEAEEVGETEEVTLSDSLNAPTVTTLNDEPFSADIVYTTDAEEVTIIGTVSESAVAIYVNSYQLTQYEAGSDTWVYRARADFLNYDVGSNIYEVYFEDEEGNASPSFTFEIYREAP